MKIKSTELLAELIKNTKELKQVAQKKLAPLSDLELNYKSTPDSWSIAQCLEHLNLYGDFRHIKQAERVLDEKVLSLQK